MLWHNHYTHTYAHRHKSFETCHTWLVTSIFSSLLFIIVIMLLCSVTLMACWRMLHATAQCVPQSNVAISLCVMCVENKSNGSGNVQRNYAVQTNRSRKHDFLKKQKLINFFIYSRYVIICIYIYTFVCTF